MKNSLLGIIIPVIILSALISQPAWSQKNDKLLHKAEKKLNLLELPSNLKIDSIIVSPGEQKIQLLFSKSLSYLPVRENSIMELNKSITSQLGRTFRNYQIEIITGGHIISDLVPNIYRDKLAKDSSRLSASETNRPAFISRQDREQYKQGLDKKNIVIWHSHGWYYESKLDRWEWQRARLHSTVEDIYPMGYVLPYIAPMLENAGATVFIPRERDIQLNEVIVDNDLSTGRSEITALEIVPDTMQPGFLWKDTLFNNDNPFRLGSYLQLEASSHGSLTYIPDIPEDGEYAVYISYAETGNNTDNAGYLVNYSGGHAIFRVNQQMGAGTWIYLGTFYFKKGKYPETASVVVSAGSGSGILSSDAIKFGGGMGNIVRRPSKELINNRQSSKKEQSPADDNTGIDPDLFDWKLSNKPRYMEAARYFLQYSGMPDSIVYSLNNFKNDYNDDYQSRGEWVDYLMGSPNGPSGHRNVKGLGIPVDLSMAFHTDAGILKKDSIVGTLAIYSSDTDEGHFPNGQSKLASRDLADILQSQIVKDLRQTFRKDWTRRGLWDKQYSEAYRPNVPTMLLELLSHQNLADMSYGLDPRFRFTVSRSIYKGMLRFLAFQEGKEYIVQPLAVNNFSITSRGGKSVRLSWSPVPDPLEPTAIPNSYRLYTRRGKQGFDQGIIVNDTTISLELEKYNEIYSFKITAVNEGGESFPSEVLSAGFVENTGKTALVVNAFDRISGPTIIDGSEVSGVAMWDDQGVPYIRDVGQTGMVYDFRRKSPWLDDDNPGWGASYANDEGKIIPGNTFDFTILHGEAIMASGISFISTSDEAFERSNTKGQQFSFVDIIFGEEKSTPGLSDNNIPAFRVFTPGIISRIKEIADDGGNIFISGAYIASDHIISKDTITAKFAEEVLHYKWRTNHAVATGKFYATDYARSVLKGNWEFNTAYNPTIYTVEAPDAIEPAGEGAITAFRYTENNTSAGVLYNGLYKTVILGFPFETIPEKDQRLDLMTQLLDFFLKQ